MSEESKVALVPEVTETPEVVETEVDESTETQPDDKASDEKKEDSETDEKPVDEEKHKESRLQKRIGNLTRKRYEAESRAAAAEARAELLERMIANGGNPAPQENAKPKREQYQSDEEYIDALTDWKVDNKLQGVEQKITQKQSQTQVAQSWEEKIAKARKEYDDFDESYEELQDAGFQVFPAVNLAIQSSDLGPDILRYLAKNPDDARKLSNMNQTDAIRFVGRLESKIEGEKAGTQKKVASVSKAPKPVEPVSPTGAVKQKRNHIEHPEDYTTAEWIALERERKEKLNKR